MPTSPRISAQKATTILRELQPGEAFYFYRGMDAPLNVSARSLQEFLDRVNTVEAESLSFHTGRGDFEQWISMLGDADLARKVAALRKSNLQGEPLRSRLHSTAKTRVDKLSKLSTKTTR